MILSSGLHAGHEPVRGSLLYKWNPMGMFEECSWLIICTSRSQRICPKYGKPELLIKGQNLLQRHFLCMFSVAWGRYWSPFVWQPRNKNECCGISLPVWQANSSKCNGGSANWSDCCLVSDVHDIVQDFGVDHVVDQFGTKYHKSFTANILMLPWTGLSFSELRSSTSGSWPPIAPWELLLPSLPPTLMAPCFQCGSTQTGPCWSCRLRIAHSAKKCNHKVGEKHEEVMVHVSECMVLAGRRMHESYCCCASCGLGNGTWLGITHTFIVRRKCGLWFSTHGVHCIQDNLVFGRQKIAKDTQHGMNWHET